VAAKNKTGGVRAEIPPARRGVGLVLLAVSIIGSLALSELILRVAWVNPFRNEDTDYLIRLETSHAFRDLSFDRTALDPDNPRARLRTDGRSYILPSRRFDDPDFTVAFLGGSTTEQVAVMEGLRFPALVSTLLEERGLRVNTLNAGKSGITSHDSINLLLNHVVFDEPDVVVMMHAYNDIGRLSEKGEYQARRAGPMDFRTVLRWVQQRASIHSSLFGALRWWWQSKHGFEPEKFGRAGQPTESKALPSEQYVARLKAFAGICRAFGIVPVLMTQPVINMRTPLTPEWHDPRNQESFNHLIRQVGEEDQILVIDLVKFLFEEVDDWNVPMVVFYDGVHFNDHGSKVIAPHIAERLYEEVLRPRASEPPPKSIPDPSEG